MVGFNGTNRGLLLLVDSFSLSPSRWFLSLLSLFVAVPLFSAVPTLDNLFPAGGQAGSTFTLTPSGKLDPWPVKVWFDCAGVEAMPSTNSGQFTVTIAKDAPVGPHVVRAFNADGSSEPRTFIIGRYPEVTEQEPNDGFAKAQRVASLPVVVNGRLEKRGDVDSFAVRVEAGRWLVAAVDGYALGSPMDPFLHVLDEHGTKLALSTDTHNLDPFIAFKVERTGLYVVQVSAFGYPPAADVQLAGSAACIYRLTITDGPFAIGTLPAGAQRGTKSTVQLAGWNLAAKSSLISVDTTACPLLADKLAVLDATNPRALTLQLGESPELVEIEPNNTVTNATPITLPCAVNGRIDPPGDVDRFSFKAKKGERLTFRLAGASLGSALDAWVRIEDAAGKQLAFADDATTAVHDPVLSWTAPSDDTFLVAVGDLFHKGDPTYRYRLDITPPRPDFRATVDAHTYAVGRGLTNTIKLTVTQSDGGVTNLVATVNGLPAGVNATPVEVPAKGGEVKLSLIASDEAQPTNCPVQVFVSVKDSSPLRSRAAVFRPAPNNIAGELLITQIEQLWLTVTPGTPPPRPPPGKKKK